MGYLGGVEQTRGIGTGDGAEEHSVGDAGDEVADAIASDERRDGQGVGKLACFERELGAFALSCGIRSRLHVRLGAMFDRHVGHRIDTDRFGDRLFQTVWRHEIYLAICHELGHHGVELGEPIQSFLGTFCIFEHACAPMAALREV